MGTLLGDTAITHSIRDIANLYHGVIQYVILLIYITGGGGGGGVNFR